MNNEAYKSFDLKGKTAYVTGGGGGLGYYMARGLLRSGARVMIAARRENVLQEAVDKLRAETGNQEVSYQTVDLSHPDSIAASASRAIEALGGVDILVGNAGVEATQTLDVIDEGTTENVFQVNVFANMSLAKHFLPHMQVNNWGRMIFSSSILSKRGSSEEGFSAYAGAKSAINGFVRNAAVELGRSGITVNSIIIGMYMTDMVKKSLKASNDAKVTVDKMLSMTALGRFGDPENLEGPVRLLASDAGSYITGSELFVDGGLAINLKPVN